MASSVVVKVKYGDTLRRFNAPLNGNQRLAFDIEGLRAKICSLFNFTADADLKLTYIDEDLDMVALVDDEDLHDVVRQGLNPVRITVQLNTGKAASARSSGTSTPVRPQGRNLNQNMNAQVADLLKSVPESLREPLSKLSAEVASKAVTTTPVFADLIDSITKVGQSFLNAHHPPQSGQTDVAASKEAAETQMESVTSKDSSASGDQKASGTKWDAVRCRSQSSCDRKKTQETKDDSEWKLGNSVDPFSAISHDEGSSAAKGTIANDAPKVNTSPFAHSTEGRNMRGSGECPFRGLAMPMPGNSLFPPFSKAKSFSFGNPAGADSPIFHRGVRCDGCGVLPITGPRFKSKVKDNHDLCRICFEQMGKDADYVRIDFPAPYSHPWSFRGNQIMNAQPWAHPPPLFFPHVGKHMKQFRPKLDSRFIMDITIMDGTILAPKTPFTKIWRMRNNGNLPWTRGTQLLWIGGDKFSSTDSVEIEVPVAGFYPENEVDVVVDFVAPELPGRYISYWKMASPSGQKFGQRVWVLVQVDASLSVATSAAQNSLNLNLPPEGTGEPQALDVDDEPLVDVEYHQTPVVSTTDVQKPLVDEQPNYQSSQGDFLCDPFTFSIASTSSAPVLTHPPTTSELVPATQATSSPVMYPTLEADLLNPLPASTAGLPVEPAAPSQTQAVVGDDVEQVLLKELEEMGFKQVDLNKEVLRKNEYNFDLSLDELCNVSEWDLLLGELQGMGFDDHEMNKRVLAKNNGSLKHAVMDLITRERV